MRSTKVSLDQFTIFTSSKSTTLYWVRAHRISFIFWRFDFMWMGVPQCVCTRKLSKTRVYVKLAWSASTHILRTLKLEQIVILSHCLLVPFMNVPLMHSSFIHLLANYLAISIHRLKNWLLKVVVNFFFDSFRCKWCRQPKVDTYYFKKIFCPFISLTNWSPHKLDCVGRQKLGHIFQLYGCIWFIMNGQPRGQMYWARSI